MHIIDGNTEGRKTDENLMQGVKGDIIDIAKFNSLPAPVTAVLFGGSKYWIDTLCVQTGCMSIDVCGMLDKSHFSDVKQLIDIDGGIHDPDDFWLDV